MQNQMDRRFFLLSAASLPITPYLKYSSDSPPSEAVYVRSDQTGRLWTIGNHLVERTVAFGSLGLATQSWKHKVTKTDFMAQPFTGAPDEKYVPGAEFSFQANGLKVQGYSGQEQTQLQFLDSKTEAAPPDGKTLRILLRITLRPSILRFVIPHMRIIL